MNEGDTINVESVTVIRNGPVSILKSAAMLEPAAVEASNADKGENGGVQARSSLTLSSSSTAAAATEEININVFYDEFIAFVAWSKKIQEMNRVNLATVNSNVKLVNSKCDKILSSGRLKRYNTAILPLLQCGEEVNCDFNSQNLREEKPKNGIATNCDINIERMTLNKRPRPRLSPVKRKESTEDEDDEEKLENRASSNNNTGRRASKRIRCMEAIELAQDLAEEENKENATDAQEEANILQINLVTLRGEFKNFCAVKHENNIKRGCSFDEILVEYNRLGFAAKRIYNKAKKLNILMPYIGPEIKTMIGQLEAHCSSFVGDGSQLSKQLDERFDLAKEMLNFEGEMEDCEEGGINEEIGENEMIVDGESLESDIETLQYFCRLYLQKSPDKEFYTEAKRLCTRSVIITKLAKKNNYHVQRVEKLMDEVFDKVSSHYESLAPSRELKYNLLMQNKRYKTRAKQLNYYDRFLGSKKLKMPENKLPSPKKPTVSPIKLQLLPQVSIKKVQFHKKMNGKVEETELLLSSGGGVAANVEVFLTRYNNLYKKLELFLSDEKVKSGDKRIEAGKKLGFKRQACCQLLKDAQDYERANWTDEEQVSAARMVIRGTKKISGIIADNENWFRRYPFVYYEADSDWSKQTEEWRSECLVYQKNELKALVLKFLENKESDKDCYEDAVQFGTELVRLNRRSLEQAGEVADDIYKLTLRLYRNVTEFYEGRASREQIQQHLHARNKKIDERRKILHYYDSEAKIEQLSDDSFSKSFKKKKGSRSTTSNVISRSEAQDEPDIPKKNKNSNAESAKGVSDIRCYFTKKSTTSTENNVNEAETDISGIKGDWRGGERGGESESEAESNCSEYKASEVEPSEDETEGEEEEDEAASEEQNEGEGSDEESSETETSSENDDDDDEEDNRVRKDDEESLKDKKCTVYVSGLSRHHTPLYMRSFLELKRIQVVKCNVLPGPKSAAPSIAVTVNAIHKKIIKKLWGKTFKLTFHIH